MIAPEGEPEIGPEQLSLLDAEPVPGQRWQNLNTGSIVVILKAEQRRFAWVTIRVAGSVQTLTLANFLRHFTPYQPTNGRQQWTATPRLTPTSSSAET